MSRRPGGRPPQPEGGAGGVKALLIIVVAVVLGVGILSRLGTGHPTGAAKASTTTTLPSAPVTVPHTTTTTVTPPSKVTLQVLNGVSATSSYAGEWTTKLKSSPGYVTESPANATATVSASAIYMLKGGLLPEAEALANTVGIATSAIVTTVPPASSAPIPTSLRSKADLVLVVGPDLVSKA